MPVECQGGLDSKLEVGGGGGGGGGLVGGIAPSAGVLCLYSLSPLRRAVCTLTQPSATY